MNQRFKEHGFGYEFNKESNQLIRIDSKFIHSEVVKPALLLLQSDLYLKGANEEFIKAHEHYRHQQYDAAIIEAAKSFESCLKGICDKHKWTYDPQKDTASKLIAICLKNNLVPLYMEEQLTHLRCLLESGIPTVRNKSAGHGQGSQTRVIPQELAGYALHLTATNLLFLGECEKKLK